MGTGPWTVVSERGPTYLDGKMRFGAIMGDDARREESLAVGTLTLDWDKETRPGMSLLRQRRATTKAF
jgi:hypothetical protein